MIGFSTIAIANYSNIDWNKVLSKFEYFDISPLHFSIISSEKILSMQGIFYGMNLDGGSLVKSDDDFMKLKSLFSIVLHIAEKNNIPSLIWGAPSTRNNITASDAEIEKRTIELLSMASSLRIKLYFEALPHSMCDYLNTHEQLLQLHATAGIGGIHYDICTAIHTGEINNFLAAKMQSIDRYHLSNSGYSLSVLDDELAMSLHQQLQKAKKKGTLEVQNFDGLTGEIILKKISTL